MTIANITSTATTARSSGLHIEFVQIEVLRPDPENARLHSVRQIKQIAASIKAFGMNVPLAIDAAGNILAGNGRYEALKLLGRQVVPVIRLDHLTPERARAFAIADNRLTDTSTWDDKLLGEQLKMLSSLDLTFDLEATGFTMGEIDLRIEGLDEPPEPEDEPDPPAPAAMSVSSAGDLWILGDHRLLVGDARDPDAYRRLMAGERVQAAFTDVPYNVRVSDISGLGKQQHREFASGSGEMTAEAYTAFLTTVFDLMAAHSNPGAVHFSCIDWKHLQEMLAAGSTSYDSLLNLCVWNKGVGGMGSLYRSTHELVLVFKAVKGPHRNNVDLGRYGRNRKNVWDYPGANTFLKSAEDADLLRQHPTPKPVKMVADAILDVTARGDRVLDPFLGTSATLLACERTGRACRGIEIDPLYADLGIRRWQRHTGGHAVLERTGMRFDELEALYAEEVV